MKTMTTILKYCLILSYLLQQNNFKMRFLNLQSLSHSVNFYHNFFYPAHKFQITSTNLKFMFVPGLKKFLSFKRLKT